MNGGHGANTFVSAMLRACNACGLGTLRQRGFTVIEVLIVLAVTGALFVSAAVLIAGRQQQTQFGQAIREIESQIQQVINETGHGFYPSSGNFTCQAGGSGAPSFTPSAAGQGTNQGCIFLGKAIQFGVTGDPEQFTVMNLAGRQKNAAGAEVSSLAEAQPRVVAPAAGAPNVPNTSVSSPLLYGLTTAWADAGVVAFVSNLTDVSNPTNSSVQQLNVVRVNNTQLGMTAQNAVAAVNSNLAASPQNPSGGVRVCFASGSTNQSGLITIGGQGRGLSVTLDIKSNGDCS